MESVTDPSLSRLFLVSAAWDGKGQSIAAPAGFQSSDLVPCLLRMSLGLYLPVGCTSLTNKTNK